MGFELEARTTKGGFVRGLARSLQKWTALAGACLALALSAAPRPERIVVAADGHGFVETPSGREFVPWGFNYDHDERGRLLEDYWVGEWSKVVGDFHEMAEL